MVGLGKTILLILLTVLGLAVFTRYEDGRLDSQSKILGYPVISIAQQGPRGLVALGQVDARGVLVVAQLGFGLVAFAQGGLGLLFGIGQLMGGLVAVAQVGLGLGFFLGQAGFGLQAMGQGVAIRRGREYMSAMNAEFNELLTLRPPRRTDAPA